MAQVSWSIVAIDKTRAAFASVNQGLRNLATGGDQAQKKVMGLGLKMAGIGSIAVLIGSQVRAVSEDIRSVPGVNKDTIESWDRLNASVRESRGVIQNMVASSGHGLASLGALIKFGAIAAVEGLSAAQQDLLDTEREAAAARRDESGQLTKEIESMRRLGEARKALRLVNEKGGSSIMRRREEALAMEKQAAATQDLTKKNNLLADAAKLRTDAQKDEIVLQDKLNAAQKSEASIGDDLSRVFLSNGLSLKQLNAERLKTLRLLGESNSKILGGDKNALETSIKLNDKLSEIDRDRLQLLTKKKEMQNSLNDAQAKVASGEADISRVWQSAKTSLRQLNEERAKTLRLLMESNNAMLGGDDDAIPRSIKLNEKLADIDKDRLQIMRKNKDLAYEAGDVMATAFEKAVFEGGKLSDVLRGIAQDLLRLVFRNMVTQPLAEGISGGLRGLFRAKGGPVSSGSPYIVGENGPELFTPSTAGRIIPNHNITSEGGAGGNNFTFNYSFPMGVTKAELIPALQATKAATIAAFKSMQVRSARAAYA